MNKERCDICGKPVKLNSLCYYHNELRNEGIVIKDKNNNWSLKDEENLKCLICEEETISNHLFCLDCYQDVKEIRNNFDHTRIPGSIYQEYFSLKESLLETKDLAGFNEKIMMMWALAEEYQINYGYNTLIDRAKPDILEAVRNFNDVNKKTKSLNNQSNFNDEDFRNKWPREHQCEDGHYVRSLSEMLIDNWLYNHGYIHAYEKSVFMNSDPDAIVLSDFYLPQGNVYIEYWGLEENQKYAKRKAEKIKLYEENNYNRIDLSEKDIRRLNDILPRLLAKYIK